MARGQDLAGLAALAGLAYMAHKRGKGQETTGVDPDAASGAGMSPMDAAAEMGGAPERVDAEAMADMGPRGSRAKVNTETGDLYYPEGAPAPAPARAAPTRSAAAAPARARPNIVSREEGMKNYVPRRAPAANPDYGNEGRTYESKAKPKAKYETPYDRMNRENREAGIQFKKGGKTKKMASGGMSSASKRADGIASRGKTKCKMY